MNQITVALTKKYGPLPGYAWAGIAALAAWLILPRISGMFGSSSSAAPAPPGTPSQPAGAVSYGYPGSPGPAGPPGPAGAPGDAGPRGIPAVLPAPAGQPQWRRYTIVSGDTLWGIAQKFLGNGSRWPEIYRASTLRSGDPNLIYPGEVVNIPVGGAGVGGASRGRSIGNRRGTLMSAHHPDLKTPVRYTQTLAAVGGPENHVASIHAIAARAGVHPARLLALNPHYSGVIRIH